MRVRIRKGAWYHRLYERVWIKDLLTEKYEGSPWYDDAEDRKDRLEHGRMSICPFFWAVVIATLFYIPVIRPYRALRMFLLPRMEKHYAPYYAKRRFRSIVIRTIVCGIFFGLPVMLMGTSIYMENLDMIRDYAGYKRAVAAKKAHDAEIDARWKEKEAREKAEDQIFLSNLAKTNPGLYREVMALGLRDWRIAQREAREKVLDNAHLDYLAKNDPELFWNVMADRRAKALAEEMKQAAEDAKWRAEQLWRWLGPILTTLGLIFIVLLFFCVVFMLDSRWWRDTKRLLHAFYRAKKERVCPFLETVNGDDANQRA